MVYDVFYVGGFYELFSIAEVNADGIDGFIFNGCWFVSDNVVVIVGFLDKFRGVILEAVFFKECRIREKICK